MQVVSVYTFGAEDTPVTARDKLVRGVDGHGIQAVQILACVCNAAKVCVLCTSLQYVAKSDCFRPRQFTAPTTEDDLSLPRKIQGDATDTALLRFSEFLCHADTTRSHYPELYSQAFSSATKYAIKVVKPAALAFKEEQACMPDREGMFVLMMKGAPDILIKKAISVYDPSQNMSIPLDAEARAAIMDVQSKWSSKGQRVLMLARKYIPAIKAAHESPEFADYITSQAKDLEIIGLVGIVDPPRPEIPEVIKICRQAGIKVFMVRTCILRRVVAHSAASLLTCVS